MRISTTVVGPLALTVAALLVAAPASAAEWTRADKTTDGFVGGDIARLTADNGADELSTRTDFVDLIRRKARHHMLVIDTNRADGRDYLLYTDFVDGEYHSSLVRTVPFSDADSDKIKCGDLTVRWRRARDYIAVHIPQHCLKRPDGDVRVGWLASNDTDGWDWAPRRYAQYSPWIPQD